MLHRDLSLLRFLFCSFRCGAQFGHQRALTRASWPTPTVLPDTESSARSPTLRTSAATLTAPKGHPWIRGSAAKSGSQTWKDQLGVVQERGGGEPVSWRVDGLVSVLIRVQVLSWGGGSRCNLQLQLICNLVTIRLTSCLETKRTRWTSHRHEGLTRKKKPRGRWRWFLLLSRYWFIVLLMGFGLCVRVVSVVWKSSIIPPPTTSLWWPHAKLNCYIISHGCVCVCDWPLSYWGSCRLIGWEAFSFRGVD